VLSVRELREYERVLVGKKREPRQFSIIQNVGFRASIEVGKVYRLLKDDRASEVGHVHVIDESCEDCFVSEGGLYASRIA
jgi:hypothetical protein